MTGLDTIREERTACLEQAGVRAVTAWSGRSKTNPEEAVVAVSLRGCTGMPGGFQAYMGERYNRETGRWEELYGRRAKLTFGLDIYASGLEGGARCQTTFDRLADAFQEGLLPGLRLEHLQREETLFDKELGLFRCPVQAECDAYLYALTDE